MPKRRKPNKSEICLSGSFLDLDAKMYHVLCYDVNATVLIQATTSAAHLGGVRRHIVCYRQWQVTQLVFDLAPSWQREAIGKDGAELYLLQSGNLRFM